MSSNTPNLSLYKKNPATDGNDTFNITTMLNENWDKIDQAVAPLFTSAPVNVLASVKLLRNTLESINNTRKVAQLPAVTIGGSTVVNLLGRDGNCEDTSKFATYHATLALDAANKVFGQNGIKITATDPASGAYLEYPAASLQIDQAKYYVMVGYLKNGTAPSIALYLNDFISVTLLGAQISDNSKFTKTFIKFTGFNKTGGGAYFGVLLNENAIGQYGYVDGLMIKEITQAEYNDATYEPPDYLESVQFLRNPAIRSNGKNLLPSFDKWLLHANTKMVSPYKLQLNASGTYQLSLARVPVKPSQQYTISRTVTNGRYIYLWYDAMGQCLNPGGNTLFFLNSLDASVTVMSPAGAVALEIGCDNSETIGTFYFENPMLEEGAVASTFEPNRDELLVIPVALADGETITYDKGKATVTKLRETDLVMDGGWDWSVYQNNIGFKSVFTNKVFIPGVQNTSSLLVTKYDGKVLPQTPATLYADYCWLHGGGSMVSLGIGVPDTDSGWGEDYTPTADEIKAYFFGWKMNNGIFGTAYNGTGTKTWTKCNAIDNAGALTIVPTYLADPKYTPYRLHYQLAKPVVYELQPQGGISLAEGINQVEVKSGVMLGEVAYLTIDVSNIWHINSTWQGDSRLKYKARKILAVYKNGVPDLGGGWIFRETGDGGNAYGIADVYTTTAIDKTATYTVDYEVLPEAYNAQIQTMTMTDDGSLRDAENVTIKEVTSAQYEARKAMAAQTQRLGDFKTNSWFRTYQKTAQSISAITSTKLLFDAKNFDNKNEFSPATSEATVREPGAYEVTAGILIAPIASTDRLLLGVAVNGTVVTRIFDFTVPNVSDNFGAYGSTVLSLNTGDKVALYLYSSGAVTTVPDTVTCYFSMRKTF